MHDVTLLLGDSALLLQNIPDNTIDLTVTSPPYDTLRTYNDNIEQWSFDKFKHIAQELFRVTKDGSCVVWNVSDAVFNGSESGTSFKQALYFMELGFNLHDTMIWHKLNPMPLDTRIPRYWQAFEYMFIFSKGKPKQASLLREATISNGRKSQFHQRMADGSLYDQRYEATADNIVLPDKPLTNVWSMYTCMSNTERTGHPAQFPLELAERHILSWCAEHSTVLDPFMGSGTTGVASVIHNRKFIGMEIDSIYYSIAQQRLAGAKHGKLAKIDKCNIDSEKHSPKKLF